MTLKGVTSHRRLTEQPTLRFMLTQAGQQVIQLPLTQAIQLQRILHIQLQRLLHTPLHLQQVVPLHVQQAVQQPGGKLRTWY